MTLFEYKNKENLENELCGKIAQQIKDSIELNGLANLLVSGGSTPKKLFQKLSTQNLDWSKVNIGLVDERFVPTAHAKSNEYLIKQNLLINQAKSATFFGLVHKNTHWEENLKEAQNQYKVFDKSLNICLLGMGADGHTASLFPKDKYSKAELQTSKNHLVLNTKADVFPFERVTCSKHLITKSEHLFLMITGEEKKIVLLQAKEKSYPIAYFFEADRTNLEVYYSKN